MHKVSPRAPSPLSVSLLLIWVMLHCFSLSFSLRARFAYFFRSSQYARRGFSLFFCYRYIHALSFFLSLPPLNMRLKSIPTTDSRLIRGVHKEHFVRSVAALFLSSRGDPQDARGSESIRLYTYTATRVVRGIFFYPAFCAHEARKKEPAQRIPEKLSRARARHEYTRVFIGYRSYIMRPHICRRTKCAEPRGRERERKHWEGEISRRSWVAPRDWLCTRMHVWGTNQLAFNDIQAFYIVVYCAEGITSYRLHCLHWSRRRALAQGLFQYIRLTFRRSLIFSNYGCYLIVNQATNLLSDPELILKIIRMTASPLPASL